MSLSEVHQDQLAQEPNVVQEVAVFRGELRENFGLHLVVHVGALDHHLVDIEGQVQLDYVVKLTQKKLALLALFLFPVLFLLVLAQHLL